MSQKGKISKAEKLRQGETTLQAIKYLQRLGAASFLLGLGGATGLGITFWWSCGLIYAGLIILFFDVYLEPNLRKPIRASVLLVIIACAAGYAIEVVFLPAPLKITPTVDIGNYPEGTTVSNIAWKPYYTDFRVTLTNPTDNDYADLDVEFATNMIIWDTQQVTHNPEVYFIEAGKLVDFRHTDTATGQEHVDRVVNQVARMMCKTLPKHSSVEIILALSVNPEKDGDVNKVLFPKEFPKELRLRAEYKVRNRPHSVLREENPIKFKKGMK